MRSKQIAMTEVYYGKDEAAGRYRDVQPEFDYGPLARLPRFSGTHPAVMAGRMARFDWQNSLDYRGTSTTKFDHDRIKYRILTFLEQRVLGGRTIGGFGNYKLIKRG
jgi:hypothetical protein